MALNTSVSFDDLFEIGKTEAQTRRPELTFNEGDLSEMLNAVSAAMAETVDADALRLFRNTFINGASGDDLDIVVEDRFGLPRKDAVQATGTLTLARASFAQGAGTIPAGTVVATDYDAFGNFVQIATDFDVGFGATDLGPKTVTAAAINSGPGGNIGANKIVRTVSALFDSSIVISNAAAFAGGAIAESDQDYRIRAINYLNTIRRGTIAALEYGAKKIDGVTYATVVETNGIVSLYIADSSGNSSATIISDVRAEIEDWRAAGIVVNVIGASVLTITPIAVSIAVRPGVDKNQIAANIKQSIVNRLNRLKIGESATMAQIYQAVLNVDPDGITDATVTATLTAPLPNQAVRCAVTDITVS